MVVEFEVQRDEHEAESAEGQVDPEDPSLGWNRELWTEYPHWWKQAYP